jgi:hypothetical protein
MATKKKDDTPHFDENSWHSYIAKISSTLPPDVAKAVLHSADEAGAQAGTTLLLEILSHLRIGDHDHLAEKAREAVKKHKGE